MSPAVIVNDGNIIVEKSDQANGHQSIATKTSVLHRSLHSEPMKVVRAEGLYVELQHGQKILDSTGGAAVACLGHGNSRVNAAMQKQMSAFSYSHTLLFTSSVAEELANLLVDSTDGQMSKAFIVSSGSEAMEAALKLARQYYLELPEPQSQRTKFIGRKQSYHGVTLGALSMSGHVARRKLFEPMLSPNISHVSACNAYRGMQAGETIDTYVSRLADELDAEFTRLGPAAVCAFVCEPVVGAALGCVPAVEGYLKAMETVCRKYGALMIFDEVMCGMGRCGTLHTWQQYGVVPDIQTIGKGLGGGYAPVAGLLINKRIVDVLDHGTGAFSHGQTYQGHPLACAGALEVQKIIKEERLLQNVRLAGDVMMSYLHSSLGNHPNVGDIRGRGLFIGVSLIPFRYDLFHASLESPLTAIKMRQIEFVKDKATKAPFEVSEGVANGVHKLALGPKYSLSLYPGSGSADGMRGDHVILSPAYTVTEVEVRLIVDLTTAAVEEYFRTARTVNGGGHW